MVRQARRGHLTTGHAVDRVVDEDDGDVLTARCGMHRLGRADGRKVTIALIGEDDVIRQHALDARRHRRRASMGGLDHIATEEVVAHDRAANGRHTDGLALDAELIDGLGDKAMHDAMGATRTEVGNDRQQRIGALEDDLLLFFRHATHPLSGRRRQWRRAPRQASG